MAGLAGEAEAVAAVDRFLLTAAPAPDPAAQAVARMVDVAGRDRAGSPEQRRPDQAG